MNQQEVAKHFGISQSTVSIALTHPHSPRVSRKLRNEIIGFCRANAPDCFRNIHTWNIAFLGHENYHANPFYSELFFGVEQAATKLGYTLILGNLKRLKSSIDARYFDGIIDARRGFEINDKLSPEIPQVLLNNANDDLTQDCIMPDNFSTVNLAIKHLLELGHRKIGFFAFNITDRKEGLNVHMRERMEAFLVLARRYNISPDYCRVINADEKNFTEMLAQAIRDYLKHHDLPEAFIFPDSQLSSFMAVLEKENLRIPEDVSIIGWDNLDKYAIRPFSTSVDFNFMEMGCLALETLHRRIENPNTPHRRINVEPKLIVRNSVRIRNEI